MRPTAIAYLLFIAALPTTAVAAGDAPSSHFEVRATPPSGYAVGAGGLVLHITNALPTVEVPKPHTPTVFHLNAQLCARTPNGFKSRVRLADGTWDFVEYEGETRCIDLAPTIFAQTTGVFKISAQEIKHLFNQDSRNLMVEFKSSSQTTKMSYNCRGKLSDIEWSPNLLNEAHITVNGQHSLAFNCIR